MDNDVIDSFALGECTHFQTAPDSRPQASVEHLGFDST